MNNIQPTETVHVIKTIGAVHSWVDMPITVALLFALSGAVFIGIYILRRIRGQKTIN